MVMVKTVTSIESERVTRKGIGLGGVPPPRNGGGGNGSHGNGGSAGGDDRSHEQSRTKARIAMWVALASILMLFTALVSAYIVIASSDNWRPLAIPRTLWLSTALIIASSWTFRVAGQSLKQGDDSRYGRWLLLTLALGLAFLGSQLLAWRQLVAQGFYLSGNQHSAFFYLLTGVHAVHLLGGILAMNYLLLRTRRRQQSAEREMRRRTAADIVGLYWHFMDGLWVFLFLLLLLWR
jgi:cytochrome c oxidase subunit 3